MGTNLSKVTLPSTRRGEASSVLRRFSRIEDNITTCLNVYEDCFENGHYLLSDAELRSLRALINTLKPQWAEWNEPASLEEIAIQLARVDAGFPKQSCNEAWVPVAAEEDRGSEAYQICAGAWLPRRSPRGQNSNDRGVGHGDREGPEIQRTGGIPDQLPGRQSGLSRSRPAPHCHRAQGNHAQAGAVGSGDHGDAQRASRRGGEG